jgi:hypothetical protein
MYHLWTQRIRCKEEGGKSALALGLASVCYQQFSGIVQHHYRQLRTYPEWHIPLQVQDLFE